MSLGPLGGVTAGLGGSAAGSPLSQTAGAGSERASKDAAAQERTTDSALRAERTSGVGQTEGDQQTSDRDADGRRLWERQKQRDKPDDPEQPETDADDGADTGGRLDLIG